jgi:hypothetical protein
MAFVTLGTVAPGDVLRANSGTAAYNNVIGNVNEAPRGVLARATRTTNQTGITTVTDITSMTVTFTAQTSRLYCVTFYCAQVAQAAATGFPAVLITDSSNTQVQVANMRLLDGDESFVCIKSYETGLSGSVTRKIRANVNAGNMGLYASATKPMVLVVEDIGVAP